MGVYYNLFPQVLKFLDPTLVVYDTSDLIKIYKHVTDFASCSDYTMNQKTGWSGPILCQLDQCDRFRILNTIFVNDS